MRRRNERHGPPGSHPDEFRSRWPGTPGACGQFVLWDQPLTYIADPRDPLLYGSGLDFLWVAGDGNRPTIWQGAPLNPLDPDPLAVVGVPVAEVAPYQVDGADVAIEGTTGASSRGSAVPHDAAAGEDEVDVLFFRTSPAAAGEVYFSTRDAVSGQGVEVYRGAATQLVGYARTAGGAAGTSAPAAGHVAPGAISMAVLIHSRVTDTVTLWTPGAVGAAGAVADGAIVGGGMVLADNPAASAPVPAGGGLLVAARIIGAGRAAEWSADTYAKCFAIRRYLTGIRATSPLGTPGFTRASARVAQDRNGRLHRYSPGMPVAGDSLGYDFVHAYTNYTYRNIDISAAAGWQATGGVLTANVDDSAALAAAADGDISGWGRVIELANATGVDQYLYNDGPIGVVTACHLLCRGRMVAGAGARVGWYEPTGGTWTDVGALVDAHAQTVLQNTSPPNVNCRFAAKVPNGCTVRSVAQHAGRGANAPRYSVPNWLTAGIAAGDRDTLTIPGAVVSNGRGGAEVELAYLVSTPPANAFNRVLYKGGTYIVSAVVGAGSNSRRAYIYDGTTVPGTAAHVVAAGVYERIVTSWGGTGLRATDPSGTATSVYDGAFAAGDITIGNTNEAPSARVRNLRFYRQEHNT